MGEKYASSALFYYIILYYIAYYKITFWVSENCIVLFYFELKYQMEKIPEKLNCTGYIRLIV